MAVRQALVLVAQIGMGVDLHGDRIAGATRLRQSPDHARRNRVLAAEHGEKVGNRRSGQHSRHGCLDRLDHQVGRATIGSDRAERVYAKLGCQARSRTRDRTARSRHEAAMIAAGPFRVPAP